MACLTMRMSAVMAQLENSSVSPTKMQICPGSGEDQNNHQGALYPPSVQAAPCMHPGCWQAAPHKAPPQLLAVRLLGSLWIIYRLQARPTALKGTQSPGQSRDRRLEHPVGGGYLLPPHFLFQSPCIPSTHIGPHDAALGGHEDEADEDGRAQHAHSAHQRVGPLGPQAAPARGSCPRDHTQKTREAGDGPKDEAAETEDSGVQVKGAGLGYGG